MLLLTMEMPGEERGQGVRQKDLGCHPKLG